MFIEADLTRRAPQCVRFLQFNGHTVDSNLVGHLVILVKERVGRDGGTVRGSRAVRFLHKRLLDEKVERKNRNVKGGRNQDSHPIVAHQCQAVCHREALEARQGRGAHSTTYTFERCQDHT